VTRNHTGFRFTPHGDKLLLIEEGGYVRAASADAHKAWFRAGYLHNSTAFSNVATGKPQTNNYCAYALMDYQLLQTDREHPGRGLYAGGSVMTAPEAMNPYSRYYEARFYKEAPFRARPDDVLSVITSRTDYSKLYTDNLVSQGKTVWRASTTITGGYSLRASPGNYLSLAVSYIDGPAISPRVPNALNVIANWTTYF
jgi:porin